MTYILQRKLQNNTLEVAVMLVPAKQDKYNKNELGHKLVSVPQKVSDHHLHHEWQ
jgi:hypothetical protein